MNQAQARSNTEPPLSGAFWAVASQQVATLPTEEGIVEHVSKNIVKDLGI